MNTCKITAFSLVGALLSALGLAGGTIAQDRLLTEFARRDAAGKPVVLGTASAWLNNPAMGKESLFDGNPKTFFNPSLQDMHGVCWAGIELTSPKMPTRIRYLGRPEPVTRTRVWGCEFQGANRPDFKDAVTLHVAAPPTDWNSNVDWVEVKLDDARARREFRYFRVLSPNPFPPEGVGTSGGFSEVEFWGTDLPKGTPRLPASMVAASGPDSLDDALDLCRRTYDYVSKSVPSAQLKGFANELAVDTRWAAGAHSPADRARIEKVVRRLRRRILFTHPDLQFDRLLCVQRDVPFTQFNHMVDQYLGRYSHAGPGLIALDNWRTFPEKKLLLADKLPEGCVLNPCLHWNADRLLFAFCDHTRKPELDPAKIVLPPNPGEAIPDFNHLHRRYFIYECASDGSWVRQLTGVPGDPMTTVENRATVLIEDVDPCYLPDGDFVFTSTRCQNYVRCNWGRYSPAFMLYRAGLPPLGAPGPCARDIRQLSFGEANEWAPSVLQDGRLVYTRWDYIERNAIWFQGLWASRPDGTAVSHLYGNYSRNIAVVAEARSVPGSPLLVATASGHHSFTGGSLVFFDARRGEDGSEPITRLTPEIPFPEAEGWNVPGFYSSPMPVNDTLFFASYIDDPGWYPRGHPKSAGGMAAWPNPRTSAIWLVDKLGGRELIYRDPAWGTFSPIPLVKRPMPPALTSKPGDAGEGNTGVCYVHNCYDSRQQLPKGAIAAIRVNRLHTQSGCVRGAGGRSRSELSVCKETLGVVPVNSDGSCAFRVPAGLPLQLQAVDTNGMAVLTMRSFIYSQKGEVQGCTGCHEDKRTSRGMPEVQHPAVANVATLKPEVDLGYAGPFRYALSVQPIFDRKCISCHGLGKAPSFLGLEGRRRLIKDRQVAFIHAYSETDISKPGDYFALRSKLTWRLRQGHGPKLTPEEWRTLILWMDLAVPEHTLGDYGWNLPETREVDPAGEQALRAAVAAKVPNGAEIAKQPFDALVNRADEAKSRVLWLCRAEDREELLALCRKALKPLPACDVRGTCGRDDHCRCRSCWVRRGGYNDPPKK